MAVIAGPCRARRCRGRVSRVTRDRASGTTTAPRAARPSRRRRPRARRPTRCAARGEQARSETGDGCHRCSDGAADQREHPEESRRPEAVVKSGEQHGGRRRGRACVSRLPEQIDNDREDCGSGQPQRTAPRAVRLVVADRQRAPTMPEATAARGASGVHRSEIAERPYGTARATRAGAEAGVR